MSCSTVGRHVAEDAAGAELVVHGLVQPETSVRKISPAAVVAGEGVVAGHLRAAQRDVRGRAHRAARQGPRRAPLGPYSWKTNQRSVSMRRSVVHLPAEEVVHRPADRVGERALFLERRCCVRARRASGAGCA